MEEDALNKCFHLFSLVSAVERGPVLLSSGNGHLMTPQRPECGEECSRGVTRVVLVVLRCCQPQCTKVEEIFPKSIC